MLARPLASQDSAIPPGARLLHIGPHKTGTTTLQGAFHQARAELAAHGVVYAGKGRQPAHAASAIAGGTPVNSLEPPSLQHWKDLCEEVAAAGSQRVVISSERFANADEQTARAVVEGLGGSRVHIVVTLRPLSKIVPSQWQEYVKTGARYTYANWLEGMFRTPPYDKPTPTFWRRHRHDALVKRWGEIVGWDKVTVVVVDDANPLLQLRAFERLVGLPDGVLAPEGGIANRSLTLGEVEVLRRINQELAKRDWLGEAERRMIREGVIASMQKTHVPSPDEPRITTPEWAEAAVAEVSKEVVSNLAGFGVRIVGDPSVLTRPGRRTGAPSSAAPEVPASVAAGAVLGALSARLPRREAPRSKASATPQPIPVEDRPASTVRSGDLLALVGRRALHRGRRWVGRLPGRRSRPAA